MKARRVAVVEGDPAQGEGLRLLLERQGYQAALYPTPGRFLDALASARPDAVLLRMSLPGMDGKDLIRVLRSNPETRRVAIVALAGPGCPGSEVVHGLLAGADEFLRGPVEPEILLVRLQSLLRCAGRGPDGESYVLGGLAVSPEARVCRLGGKRLHLTPREFDLLVHFLRNRNRVLTRAALLAAVWNGGPAGGIRTVDKHVEALRRKLADFGRRLQTVHRVGYVLKA